MEHAAAQGVGAILVRFASVGAGLDLIGIDLSAVDKEHTRFFAAEARWKVISFDQIGCISV